MQDQTKNNPNQKQYFDIKSSPNPDATSRPVVNSDPIQVDPMVSVVSPPATDEQNIPIASATLPANPVQPVVLPEQPTINPVIPDINSADPVIEPTTQTPESPQTMSQHTVSVHKKKPIDKIIGVIILAILIVAALLVYKVKMGK